MNADTKFFTFADVLTIVNGRNQRKVEDYNGKYPIYGSGGIMGWANAFLCPENTTVIGRKGSINNPIFVERKFWNVDTAFGLVANPAILLPKFLYYFCVSFNFETLNTTVTIPSLTKANLLKIKIPIPPMKQQERIISRFDQICSMADIRRQELKKLDRLASSRFIEMFGDGKYPLKKAYEICSDIVDCPHSTPSYSGEQLIYPAIRTSEISNGKIQWESMKYVSEDEFSLRTKRLVPQAGDIVYAREGTYGDCVVLPDTHRFCLGQRTMLFRPNTQVCVSEYLHFVLRSSDVKRQADESNAGSTVPHVNVADAKNFLVPLPPRELQMTFAAFIEQLDKSKLAAQKFEVAA